MHLPAKGSVITFLLMVLLPVILIAQTPDNTIGAWKKGPAGDLKTLIADNKGNIYGLIGKTGSTKICKLLNDNWIEIPIKIDADRSNNYVYNIWLTKKGDLIAECLHVHHYILTDAGWQKTTDEIKSERYHTNAKDDWSSIPPYPNHLRLDEYPRLRYPLGKYFIKGRHKDDPDNLLIYEYRNSKWMQILSFSGKAAGDSIVKFFDLGSPIVSNNKIYSLAEPPGKYEWNLVVFDEKAINTVKKQDPIKSAPVVVVPPKETGTQNNPPNKNPAPETGMAEISTSAYKLSIYSNWMPFQQTHGASLVSIDASLKNSPAIFANGPKTWLNSESGKVIKKGISGSMRIEFEDRTSTFEKEKGNLISYFAREKAIRWDNAKSTYTTPTEAEITKAKPLIKILEEPVTMNDGRKGRSLFYCADVPQLGIMLNYIIILPHLKNKDEISYYQLYLGGEPNASIKPENFKEWNDYFKKVFLTITQIKQSASENISFDDLFNSTCRDSACFSGLVTKQGYTYVESSNNNNIKHVRYRSAKVYKLYMDTLRTSPDFLVFTSRPTGVTEMTYATSNYDNLKEQVKLFKSTEYGFKRYKEDTLEGGIKWTFYVSPKYPKILFCNSTSSEKDKDNKQIMIFQMRLMILP